MDKLQHIDDLLKKSAPDFEYAEVGASDWLAVENKLKRRKRRIYALWCFLALILVSSTSLFVLNNSNDNVLVDIPNSIHNTEKSTIQDKTNTSDLSQKTDNSNSILPEYISPKKDLTNVSEGREFQAGNHTLEGENTGTGGKFEFIPYLTSKYPRFEYQVNQSPIEVANVLVSIPKQKVPNGSSNRSISDSHWEFGVSITPSLSGQRISENSLLAGLIHTNYYEKVMTGEKSSFANSSGLNAQYHFSKNFFLGTGLSYSQRSENIRYNYTIDLSPIVDKNINKIMDYKPQDPEPISHTGSNSYHFIEIPLNLGFKTPLSTNFEFRSQFGMSYLLLLRNEGVKADYTDLSLKDLSDFTLNKNNIAINSRAGVYWNNKNFTVGAEPIFSLNLNNLNQVNTSAIIVKPYSFGFNISTNYKFVRKK